MQTMGFAGVQGVPLDRTVAQASSPKKLSDFLLWKMSAGFVVGCRVHACMESCGKSLLQKWVPCSRVSVCMLASFHGCVCSQGAVYH